MAPIAKSATLAVLATMATGCAGIYGSKFAAPPPSRAAVVVEDDRFESSARLLGVDVVVGTRFDNNYRFFLRSWVHKSTGEVSHQVYLTVVYRGDWHFFQIATSQDAEPLEVVKIDSSVISCAGSSYSGCLFSEAGISLGDDVLSARRTTGYAIKVTAQSGHALVVELTPAQISQQLDAVAYYVSGGRRERVLKPEGEAEEASVKTTKKCRTCIWYRLRRVRMA